MAFLYENDNHIQTVIDRNTVDDEDIAQIIAHNVSEDYSEVLKKDSRWNVFYHLSALRESLFNWYDFKEKSELLEIGGGFGALTGLFSEKCGHVTVCEEIGLRAGAICGRYKKRDNIDVYEGKWEDVRKSIPDKRFDYIVLADYLGGIAEGKMELAPYYMFIMELKRFLNKDGKILIVVNNSMGIKYLCGAPDDYTNMPFDSLNQYPKGSRGRTFTRQEMIKICDICRLYFKFYYPLADFRVAQMICTDKKMPLSTVKDRVIPYYTYKDSLLAVEKNFYEDIIRSKMLHVFANSFIIECSETEDFCNIDSAVVSTDRGKQHGFVTAIYRDGIVKKNALGEAGREELRKICGNIRALEKRGITIVPHNLNGSGITMPYIEEPTVLAYIQYLTEKADAASIETVIDDMWKSVLQSSDLTDKVNDKLQTYMEEVIDWGPILEKAYIDMIPLNSFWINGSVCYYDQEFVMEKYPARYILFRILNYTYAFVGELDKILSLEEMKIKYSLNELWPVFQRIEQQFVSENRDYKLYQQFYKWAEIDPETIYQRNIYL